MTLLTMPLLKEVPHGHGTGPDAAAAPFSLYPPRTRAGLDPMKHAEFPERMLALRRAHLAHGQGPATGSLQILDLEQIRLRFARRWPQVREKAMGIVEAALQRELGRDDTYVAVTDTLFYIFRVGLKRQDAQRRGHLLAADITERLCGAVPGGVAVRLRTAPFDFDRGFAGVVSFDQLRARVDAFGRAVDDHELRLFLGNVQRFEAWYRPTFHLRKGLLSAYRMSVLVGAAEGLPRPATSLCPASFNGIFEAEVDGWAVEQAAEILREPAGRGRRAVIIVPVSYETLASDRLRKAFLGHCRQLPEGARRRLILEVADIPPSLPQPHVRELARELRPSALTLLARLPPDAILAEHLAHTGITGLSLDLERMDPEARATREMVHMLAEAARGQRMRSMLLGAHAVAMCQHALRAGVDYVSGDALMAATRQPGRVLLAQRRP